MEVKRANLAFLCDQNRESISQKGTIVKIWGSYTDSLHSSHASYTARDATIGITLAGVVV